MNAALDHLEREPGEFLVDPWVRERITLVAEQRGRISAVAHLVRYGAEPDVGPAMRDTAEQWPHVSALLERVGFVRGDRSEFVYLADADRLPHVHPVSGLDVVRTLGVAGTRFTARVDAADAGYVEVGTGIGGTGRFTSGDEWADIGSLRVDPAYRRRGIATRLLVEVGDWLRLAREPRLLAYALPDEVEHRALLERHDFRLLTRTHREWTLPT